MKQTWTVLSLALALSSSYSFAGSGGYEVEYTPWTGFYVGANAGYLWSAHNVTNSFGRADFANPLFLPISQTIATSLAILGINSISTSIKGGMGGAQIGYNSQFSDRMVIGLDADLDAVGQSGETTQRSRTVATVLGTQHAEITLTKKLSYLGLLKGRLGVLATPRLLVYGAGALSYGEATFDTTYAVTNSASNFLPVSQQAHVNKMLAGWAAGGGVEWLFAPCWSMKLEYTYYDLGSLNHELRLRQSTNATPSVAFSEAFVTSHAKFTDNTVKLGINYHFS